MQEVKIEKLGRYRILDVLGQGAMGVVYKASDDRINRTVAIKTLQIRADMTEAQIKEFRERFFHEAQFAGRLSHPNVVTIYDVQEEGDLSYIAMEYVDGTTLEKMLNAKTNLPLDKTIDILMQVCDGLTYAHRFGVIHRDIKPGNIIVSHDGTAKIMDFGIAKVTTSTRTVIGTILGTPGYMSPEQITGKSVDYRSDIFSVGTVMYELFTGEKAFTGKNMTEIMYKVVNDNPPPPTTLNSTLPAMLSNIVMKALKKNPDKRYASIEELARHLKNVKEFLNGNAVGTELAFAEDRTVIAILRRETEKLFANRLFNMISFAWACVSTLLLLLVMSDDHHGLFDAVANLAKGRKPPSLTLKLNVPDAQVAIDGLPVNAQGAVVSVENLDIGEHVLSVRREHYEEYAAPLVFAAGEEKKIDVLLQLKAVEIPPNVDTAYFSIQSVPEMVKVETSYGKFLGYTPIEKLAFPSGRYTLLFSKPDFVNKKRDVALLKNKTSLVNVALDKQRGLVSIDKVYPETAILLAEGKRQPRARSGAYSLEVGEQNVTIHAEGYEDLDKTIEVKSDETLELADSLKPTYGTLWIQSNPTGAEIYLDGEKTAAGTAPLYVNQLVANDHTIKGVYRNENKSRIVKVEKNDTTEVTVVFSNPNGFIDLVTTPPGAEVYWNTVRVKDMVTPSVMEVKPGFHKLRLAHPQFKKFYEVTVRVRALNTTKIEYQFE